MLLQYSVDDEGQPGFSVGREDTRAGIIGGEDHQGIMQTSYKRSSKILRAINLV